MRADLNLDGSRREEEEFKGCQQSSTSEVMVIQSKISMKTKAKTITTTGLVHRKYPIYLFFTATQSH
jgi:hypothetical protein